MSEAAIREYAQVACGLPGRTVHQGTSIVAHPPRHPILLLVWAFLLFWGTGVVRGARLDPVFAVAALLGLFLYWQTALATWGKVVVTIDSSSATVFHGVGSVRRRRTFDLRKPARILLRTMTAGRRNRTVWVICVIGKNGARTFGESLTDEQRRYIGYHLTMSQRACRTDGTSSTLFRVE